MRRRALVVQIGSIKIGGDFPVAIQSMTNTDTTDIERTAAQVVELAHAGSELVRFTVNTEEAAQATPFIRDRVRKGGCNAPLIGDFHYNGHLLLTKYPDCAMALDKYRINPGNVGVGESHDRNFLQMIDAALKYQKPVRIGVNWGSLDQRILTRLMDQNAKSPNPKEANDILLDAMVESALGSARSAETHGLPSERIILSVKMSHVQDVVCAYTLLASRCPYSLHVGLTEAGMGVKGIVASTTALAILLQQGIGDTIRVSITPEPNGSRTQEVKVCQHVLQVLGLRQFMPSVTACPGCGRTTNSLFQEMASDMEAFFQARVPEWQKMGYRGYEALKIAVMGCIVNGPGESKRAEIGISLPGTGENPRAPVFVDGVRFKNLEGAQMMDEFKKIVEDYVTRNYAS